MKLVRNVIILGMLALMVSFSTKIEALPIPLQGPGVCGHFEIVAYGGMIPGIIWVSVPCS